MKTPKIITKINSIIDARRKSKLRAATRAVPRAAMDGYEDEPTTKLSSAFVVVLVLHVVAVGGIYAFNSIKASRRSHEPQPPPLAESAKPPAAATARNPAPTAPGGVAPRTADKTGTATATPGTTNPRPATQKQHQVKDGETATKIAGLHGVKTDDLLAANNLKESAVLHPGQTLIVPAPRVAAKVVAPDTQKASTPVKQVNVAPTKTTPGKYFVKKGDTATSIAKTYGITVADLLTANKVTDAKKLQEGQSLTIPKKKG